MVYVPGGTGADRYNNSSNDEDSDESDSVGLGHGSTEDATREGPDDDDDNSDSSSTSSGSNQYGSGGRSAGSTDSSNDNSDDGDTESVGLGHGSTPNATREGPDDDGDDSDDDRLGTSDAQDNAATSNVNVPDENEPGIGVTVSDTGGDISNSITPEQLDRIDDKTDRNVEPDDLRLVDGELRFSREYRQESQPTGRPRPANQQSDSTDRVSSSPTSPTPLPQNSENSLSVNSGSVSQDATSSEQSPTEAATTGGFLSPDEERELAKEAQTEKPFGVIWSQEELREDGDADTVSNRFWESAATSSQSLVNPKSWALSGEKVVQALEADDLTTYADKPGKTAGAAANVVSNTAQFAKDNPAKFSGALVPAALSGGATVAGSAKGVSKVGLKDAAKAELDPRVGSGAISGFKQGYKASKSDVGGDTGTGSSPFMTGREADSPDSTSFGSDQQLLGGDGDQSTVITGEDIDGPQTDPQQFGGAVPGRDGTGGNGGPSGFGGGGSAQPAGFGAGDSFDASSTSPDVDAGGVGWDISSPDAPASGFAAGAGVIQGATDRQQQAQQPQVTEDVQEAGAQGFVPLGDTESGTTTDSQFGAVTDPTVTPFGTERTAIDTDGRLDTDTGIDTDTRLGTGARAKTRTRVDTDTRLDSDLRSDADTRTATDVDTEIGRDNDPFDLDRGRVDRDPDAPFPFGGEPETESSPFGFSFGSQSKTFDTGVVQSLDELDGSGGSGDPWPTSSKNSDPLSGFDELL